MPNMSLNELKLVIAEILDEAKKKKEKVEKIRHRGAAIEAYGIYDEAFDFSEPLGAFNLYRQQGGANFGPYTAENIPYDGAYHGNRGTNEICETDERALRTVVREVIQNGLIPDSSAWAPLMERQRKAGSDSIWEQADRLFEAWYDNLKKSSSKGSSKKKDKDRPGYGPIQKHGQPSKKGRK